MTDADGRFTFSPIVSIRMASLTNSITIAPNPVSNQLRLVVSNTEPIKTIRIFDMSGKIVWQSATVINTGIIIIPINRIGKGAYSIELTTKQGVERLPFIKAGE